MSGSVEGVIIMTTSVDVQSASTDADSSKETRKKMELEGCKALLVIIQCAED